MTSSRLTATDDRLEHAKVGSWFIGPRAENHQLLRDLFEYVVDEHVSARKTLYSNDPDFVTTEMQEASTYKDSVETLWTDLKEVSNQLATHSIPFYSPRYNGHMNMDTSLPGIVGYMTAMLYNPNNVAIEASPFTTFIEKKVGLDLCNMLGYTTAPDQHPCGWGHITCDGSIANLESMWAARNLKFYPLSMKLAMEEDQSLEFLATIDPPFVVENCKGDQKLFTNLSTWELLNLKPSTVLNIPTQLLDQYGISAVFLAEALKPHLIQTKGKDALEKQFFTNINPGRHYITTTKHYSWPKGGAITGIGSENIVDIDCDDDARMDIEDLRRHLDDCINGEMPTPVYAVVAIMGSTEHGACDPLQAVVDIREEYYKKGLSFAIHADAAWGGYFASMLPEKPQDSRELIPFVPTRALNPYTETQLRNLKYADSITIDPHKSGYINYPAGSLCYRDERMRYLITWTSPYIFHSNDPLESMGVYGVEGSKPGAPAVAAYLTHKTLGLNPEGYGRLLGEAVFTCAKFYCYWATMSTKDSELIVTPLNMLPAEREAESTPEIVEQQKQFIRDRILGVTNEELIKDQDAMDLLRILGGDLMINAFACNFKIDGIPNTDVGEANYLNTQIFNRTSVNTLEDDVAARPLFLTSSVFGQDTYGECVRNFKRRLELGAGSQGDLYALVNVTMSPWPTDSPFEAMLAEEFKKIAMEEVQRCVVRNKPTEGYHGFVMQGFDNLFLVHLPMFNLADRRWQLVITADIPASAMDKYRKLHADNPDALYTIGNSSPALLQDLLKPNASFAARMDEGTPLDGTDPLATFDVANVQIIIKQSLSSANLQTTYPNKMPFYLYGHGKESHIDHVLKTSPNAQLTSDCVSLDLKPQIKKWKLVSGVVAVLSNVNESSMQPLPIDDKGQLLPDIQGLHFQPGTTYAATVYNSWEESQSPTARPIATGEITLGKSVYKDWKEINKDPTTNH